MKPLVVPMALGFFAGMLALWESQPLHAAPLDTAACEAASSEQQHLADVPPVLERGADWGKSNLSPQMLQRVARWIELQEQLWFRCGRPHVTSEAQRAAAAAELMENPPPTPPKPDPAKSDGAKTDGAKTDPGKTDPAKTELGKSEPGTRPPAKNGASAGPAPAAEAAVPAPADGAKPKPRAKPKPKGEANADATAQSDAGQAPHPVRKKKLAPAASDAYVPPAVPAPAN